MTEIAEVIDQKMIAQDRQQHALVMQEKQFELLQRRAKMLSTSRLIPDEFKHSYEKRSKTGAVEVIRNDSAVSDCAIIIEMSERLDVDPFMVARQIYFVGNKPAFYTKFAVALLHRSGILLGRLKYRTRGNENSDDYAMQAYGIERISGEEMAGPFVSYAMAKAEGWYEKNGSKWKTMAALMLQYRAASFFINTNCPEIMQGVPTVEELSDIKDITPKDTGARISSFNVDEPPPKKAAQEYINKETGEVLQMDNQGA